MTFPDWLATQPRGTLKRLERELGVGYMTLLRLKAGGRAHGRVAQLVSGATNGAVTITELVCPDLPAPAPAATAEAPANSATATLDAADRAAAPQSADAPGQGLESDASRATSARAPVAAESPRRARPADTQLAALGVLPLPEGTT